VEEKVDDAPTPRIPLHAVLIYPPELLRLAIEGEVQARLTIEENGSISTVEILRVSQREFVGPVMERIRRCSFWPAKKDGLPTRCTIRCKITFSVTSD
jgi:TonB family protein